MNRVLIRVIGAPLLLAGLALCVYADYSRSTITAVTVLIGCFAALSFHELCAMVRLKGIRPAEWVGLAAIVVNFAAVLGVGEVNPAYVQRLSALVFLGFNLLLLVVSAARYAPLDAGFTFLAGQYVLLLLFIPLPFDPKGGGPEWLFWLLFLVATNKGSDMAAYIVGKAIGRHKLAPTVSPNKTWEGSIAGLVAGAVLGMVVLNLWRARVGAESFDALTVAPIIVISAAVTVAAQLGDLVKSAVKRWAGVKDSGRLLPEFGGALDMVDSFILSAPVAAWLVLDKV
jgi:phosphatidate cytidylyltransferase